MQFVLHVLRGWHGKGLYVNRRAVHKHVRRLRELASKGQISAGQLQSRK